MNNIILLTEENIMLTEGILRAPTPLVLFLQQINTFVEYILQIWITPIVNLIIGEPLFLLPIGFIAAIGVVGIVGRLLSRD